MYVIDLIKRILHAANITIFIYLLLNIGVVSVLVYYMFHLQPWQSALAGLGVYMLSLMLALSPFGEWILRVTNRCRKIKNVEILNFIEPIFIDVKREAKSIYPMIPEDVVIFLNESEDPFAFATGRKTVCISMGMLRRPEEEIRAALAHEFGHLAHRDTDLLLMVTVGNLIVQLILFGIRLVLIITELIVGVVGAMLGGEDGFVAVALTFLYRVAWTVMLGIISWVWNAIGMILVMRASRQNEFAADEFAFNLGYGMPLCELLKSVDFGGYSGLFSSIASSHPPKEERIARLRALMGIAIPEDKTNDTGV